MDLLEIAVFAAGFLLVVGVTLKVIFGRRSKKSEWDITEENWDPNPVPSEEKAPIELPDVPDKESEPPGVEQSVDHYLNEMSRRDKERERVL